MVRHLTDDEWVAAWWASGCSPAAMSRQTGMIERGIYSRRQRLLNEGYDLVSSRSQQAESRRKWTYPAAIDLDLKDATVLVCGDLHVWPGQAPRIWEAFCAVSDRIRPDITILNGDLIDGARISRHPRLRNQNAPRVVEEMDALRSWIDMLPAAGSKFWTIGNHDSRVDSYLANMAPEIDDFAGGLSDRFSEFQMAYSVMVNGLCEVRHNFRSGIHAAYNNAMNAGISIVTSHTHQLKSVPVDDRRGRRYGVEVGLMNDPDGPQFEYSLGMPRRWASGFALLTFDEEGELMPPELCEMIRGKPIFRNRDVLAPRLRVQAGRGEIV